MLAAPAFGAEEARRAAEEVLARPEYQLAQPSLRARVWNWILEQIGRLFDFAGEGTGSVVAAIVVAVVVLGLVLLIARFARGVRRGGAIALAVPGPVGRGAAEWAAEAEVHAIAGRWREALRCRYRELVAALAAAGLVDEVPGRTTGEYLGAVRTAVPAAFAPFVEVTRAFDAVWYGDAPADVATVAALTEDAARVRAAARGSKGVSPWDNGLRGGVAAR